MILKGYIADDLGNFFPETNTFIKNITMKRSLHGFMIDRNCMQESFDGLVFFVCVKEL